MTRSLTALSLLLLATTPVAAAGLILPKQDEDPTHPRTLRIHFGSKDGTTGIDRATFQKAVNAAEGEMSYFDGYSLLNWGKKGERTICIQPKHDETFDAYKKFYDLLAKEGKNITTEVLRAECPLQEDLL
jgi:hypothetical protein